MKRFFYVILALILISSCASQSVFYRTSKSIDNVYGAVLHTPVIADLNVNPDKVEEVFEFHSDDPYFSTSITNVMKEYMISKVLDKYHGDVFILPTFTAEFSSKHAKVAVKGYVSNYKNLRSASDKDTAMLRLSASLIRVTPENYMRSSEVSYLLNKRNTNKMKAIGVTMGAYTGVQTQVFMYKHNFFDLSAYHSYKYLPLAADLTYNLSIYESTSSLKNRLSIYSGLGFGLNIYEQSFLVAQLGIEYTFSFPLQLALYVKPMYNIGYGVIPFSFMPSLSVKYAF